MKPKTMNEQTTFYMYLFNNFTQEKLMTPQNKNNAKNKNKRRAICIFAKQIILTTQE